MSKRAVLSALKEDLRKLHPFILGQDVRTAADRKLEELAKIVDRLIDLVEPLIREDAPEVDPYCVCHETSSRNCPTHANWHEDQVDCFACAIVPIVDRGTPHTCGSR